MSDSCWVPLTSRDISYEVYPSYSVIGYIPSWNQAEGVYICKGGVITGETCGTIVDTCTNAGSNDYGILYCQYFADYDSTGGDSGSPVYMKTDSGIYLFGVHWGRGTYAVYSTIDEVFNDLGWMTINN